jgi:flagellar hook-length control protein FliK
VFDQVARGIVAHAEVVTRPGSTDFHLRIEPPNLGTVLIHLTATEHTITARVVVAHEQTQVLMAGQENDLRQVLALSGITLTGFEVSRNFGESQGQRDQPPARAELAATPAKQRPRSAQPEAVPTDTIDLIA